MAKKKTQNEQAEEDIKSKVYKCVKDCFFKNRLWTAHAAAYKGERLTLAANEDPPISKVINPATGKPTLLFERVDEKPVKRERPPDAKAFSDMVKLENEVAHLL
jgi:hypothetical protein